ncbi:uncharacterized protein BX664DRAFT_170867 [Halteromyces radiatus]|uniref:uncharacterized protein n=1 Tax=Halteromyces radiatus TaxID=101107 RepID=UPI00221EAA8D|nr:uncharacterized protein BX664DRAFT_170867 [Halteromyces radiatus]KAI8084686.1 hypothetical protein BX664DRAFT_170867 [Halteromyces radiatus]
MYSPYPNILYANTAFFDSYNIEFEIDEPLVKDTFFTGDSIQGNIRLRHAERLQDTSRLDIQLSCTFQGDNHTKTKLFKLLISPCLFVTPCQDCIPFSIPIPNEIPSTIKDKTLPGTITYKLKVIHEIPKLSSSLYPKKSKEIIILDRIATEDYQSPISSEKELKITIPKDLVGKIKSSKWNKNEDTPVQARLSIPTSCFLSGQKIPLSLNIQHIAPVKHMQGIQLQLERITNVITSTGERSLDTIILAKIVLPLICDLKDYSSSVNSHLIIPQDTSPSLQTTNCPLQITYRIRAAINVDLNNLLDEPAAPSRKRDIAKGMVNSWGKKIGWTDEGTGMGTLFENTIDLELPIIIGTTTTTTTTTTTPLRSSPSSIHSLPNGSQISIASSLTSSSSSIRPKLPARPLSLTSQSSAPALFPSYHQNNSVLSNTGDSNLHWTNHFRARSSTDPSAPELCDIELSDSKKEKSYLYDLEKHTLNMASHHSFS